MALRITEVSTRRMWRPAPGTGASTTAMGRTASLASPWPCQWKAGPWWGIPCTRKWEGARAALWCHLRQHLHQQHRQPPPPAPLPPPQQHREHLRHRQHRQALALLDRYGEEADTSGQLRGQVMAKLEEVNEVLAAAGGGGGAAPEDPMEADNDL